MAEIIVACPSCHAKNRISDRKQHLGPRCGKCREPLDLRGQAVPVELGDATLDGYLHNTDLPVLVDFYSPTCGPCKSLAPVIEALVPEYFGRMLIAKVDTSHNPGCAAHFQIRGVPTLIFFKNGEVLEQLVGLPEIGHLKAKINCYAKS